MKIFKSPLAVSRLISFVMAGLIFTLVSGNCFAQKSDKKTGKKKPKFEIDLGLATFYDNNILKYSEKYLERFMDNKDQGRFHIDTYDDVVIKPSAEITSTFNIFKKQKSKINVGYNYSAYVVNNVKNWSFFSLGFQQNITKKASVKLFYSFVPDFYVRHFRDEDLVDVYGYVPETFVPFSFSKDNYGGWIQNTFFKSTRIRFSLNYAKYYHNEHYTEYDCDNFLYVLQIYQGIGKKVDLEFGYEFMTSDAKGYDEPNETKENSDDADADNEGDAYNFAVVWQLPEVFKHKHSLEGGIGYAKRYYTTDNYVQKDPEHAGRVDNVLDLAFIYQVKLNKSMKISAFYRWFGRDSRTTSKLNSNYVSNEKDYKQSQIGLEFSYNLRLN
jgi:hypothetical protein